MRGRDPFYANRPRSIYVFEWLVWSLAITLIVDVMLAFAWLATRDPTIMYAQDGAFRTIVPIGGGLLSILITFLFSEFIAHRASHNAKRLYTVVASISAAAAYIMISYVKLPEMLNDITIGGCAAAGINLASILILFRRDASAWFQGNDAQTFR